MLLLLQYTTSTTILHISKSYSNKNNSTTYQIFPIWGNFTKLVGLLEDLREIHFATATVPTQERCTVVMTKKIFKSSQLGKFKMLMHGRRAALTENLQESTGVVSKC